jgi:sialic acid synthase SpsE
MKFGNLKIFSYRPTIIAEAGVNHNCNLNLAKKYIDLAKKSGADAIKFQTYKAETLVSKISPAYWDTRKEKTKSQYNLFKKYDKFNHQDYKYLYQYSKKKKIEFMTTIFDPNIVDQYDKMISVYKISSSDITNVPLLKKIGKKKKNVCLSTGAATLKEIDFAIKMLNLPLNKICLMHCVLNYPTTPENANLQFIKVLKKKYPSVVIGYSDHVAADEDLNSIKVAFSFGAQIIEKHFTHNKKLKGNDHYHSMDKNDLLRLRSYFVYFKKLNIIPRNKIQNEIQSRKFARRSIYARTTINKGDFFNDGNLITKRPNTGLCASQWNKLIGKKSRLFYKAGERIKLYKN